MKGFNDIANVCEACQAYFGQWRFLCYHSEGTRSVVEWAGLNNNDKENNFII